MLLSIFPIAVYVLYCYEELSESFPHQSFFNLGSSVMKQVEEILQPIADDTLATVVIMFALSTIYWVVVTFLVIRALFSELDPAAHSPPNWLPMFFSSTSVQAFTAMRLVI